MAHLPAILASTAGEHGVGGWAACVRCAPGVSLEGDRLEHGVLRAWGQRCRCPTAAALGRPGRGLCPACGGGA